VYDTAQTGSDRSTSVGASAKPIRASFVNKHKEDSPVSLLELAMNPTIVLLVEDSRTDAVLIQQAFADRDDRSFRLEWVTCLADALDRLTTGGVDVVLLDLTLPDSEGIEAFDQVFRAAPEALILVLNAMDDEETGRRAVGRGAHDHLAKGHADAYWLPRALRYVTERKRAERVLRQAEERLFEEKERSRVTLDSIGDAVLATDLAYKVTYVNPMAEQMTGWSKEQALGRSLAEVFNIVDGTTRNLAANPARRAIEQDRTVGLAMDCVLIHRDGTETVIEDSAAPIHNREGKVTGAVIVFHDGSQARDVTEKMAHLAQHDVLTGLPNRVLLKERFSHAIALARRNRNPVGLLFLDLDRFKQVNDSLGHGIGDRVLSPQRNAWSVACALRTRFAGTAVMNL
jgi:PAS domain S-box-containing protein